MPLRKIRELEDLSTLDKISEEYEDAYGSPPFDLSHWDPSLQFTNALEENIKFPLQPSAFPYIYACDIDREIRGQTIARLGLSREELDCLIVPTGTSAIMFAANWLTALSVSRVIVTCPTYFPVLYSCDMAGIPYTPIYMRRDRGNWCLPEEEITAAVGRAETSTAIWLNNPIYCTGAYLTATEAKFINSMLERGVAVVLDECLSLNGMELGPQIVPASRFLGLYSPHKSVCINAVKFAVMIFNPEHCRFFSDWTDVLIGGLSSSNYLALLHFLDSNFGIFQNAFTKRIAAFQKSVTAAIGDYAPRIESDEHTHGYFMSSYAPNLPADDKSGRFLRDLIFRTGARIIPGSRNHFDPSIGFSFRINLARECPQFLSSLHRTLGYLFEKC